MDEARDAIVRCGAAVGAAGLSPGTSGNLSVRVDDHIVCTPTGADLSALRADHLSVIALDGSHVDGPRPTKETFMHAAMYREDVAVGAIIHTHSTHATAMSCLAGLDPSDAVVPLTPYLVMKGGPVALVDYRRPGDEGLGALIATATAAGHRTMLLAHHGTLAGASDLGTAVTVSIELEEAAKVALLIRGLDVRPLTPEQVAELREVHPYR